MSSSIGPWYGGGRRGGGSGGGGNPYSSDIWDPFKDRHDQQGDDTAALTHANVDWRQTDKAHLFRVDLPGVKKEEVKVEVEVEVEGCNTLQIRGERVKEQEDDTGKWHRIERHRGSFVRRFRLPENVNLDGIKCVLEHGVLNVEVPKKDVQESRRNVRYIDVA